MSRFLSRKFLLTALITTVLSLCLFFPQTKAEKSTISTYEINRQAPFNQPSYYPIKQDLSPQVYQETEEWVGRLILPTLEEIQEAPIESDWTWIEIYDAPPEAQALVGQRVRLTWEQTPEIKTYLEKVTTEIQFTNWAKKAAQVGTVLPERLADLGKIGPLQSLAGGRSEDDMIVALENVTIATEKMGLPRLMIRSEPMQITGQFYGLFQILEPVDNPNIAESEACPGNLPCPSDVFRVRPYNPVSGQFDLPEMNVRIPQQPADQKGFFYSTSREIQNSPSGVDGWYLYGAKDRQGLFTVQAIQPRRLLQLKPDQVILDTEAGLDYIQTGNWQNTPDKKGTIESLLIDPTATDEQTAIADWKLGDLALVVHVFGGTGGEKGDKIIANTVPGHFAYGMAQVVEEPITKELQFEIIYQQVYAHSSNAIISGRQSWATYMGNLQRGWLGTRPVSDILIKWEPFTADYISADQVGSPLKTLMNSLQVMMARYRTGDGTGIASVTPATSCVQDSTQALYMAMASIERQLKAHPTAKQLLRENPDDPQVIRFQEFVSLAQELESVFAPLGVIRSDWKNNSEYLAGVNNREGFISEQRLQNIALSAKSVMPRKAHDEISQIFLKQGAKLWVLRTNQVGGFNPDIIPLAPSLVFGRGG